MNDIEKTARIRDLNDRFRTTFIGGRMFITDGVKALGMEAVSAIREAVETFSNFDEGNDPHHEHDFGSFVYEGEMCGSQKVFWKIDYFDRNMEYGSEDPSDPAKTLRVLTIMLASEY